VKDVTIFFCSVFTLLVNVRLRL